MGSFFGHAPEGGVGSFCKILLYYNAKTAHPKNIFDKKHGP